MFVKHMCFTIADHFVTSNNHHLLSLLFHVMFHDFAAGGKWNRPAGNCLDTCGACLADAWYVAPSVLLITCACVRGTPFGYFNWCHELVISCHNLYTIWPSCRFQDEDKKTEIPHPLAAVDGILTFLLYFPFLLLVQLFLFLLQSLFFLFFSFLLPSLLRLSLSSFFLFFFFSPCHQKQLTNKQQPDDTLTLSEVMLLNCCLMKPSFILTKHQLRKLLMNAWKL